MREIVTIQAGSFANYIGSHFWNFQDELHGLADSAESNEVFKNHSLNSDVLFRSGETQQGLLTYTPRLVSVDFQGSLGTMSSRGTLYHENLSQSSDVLTWEGEVTTQASDPLKKNLFLQSLYMEEKNTKKANNHDGNESSSHSEFQDNDIVECLENGVQYWTDFSKVHYHPQSLYELSGLWMDAQDFDNYGIGRDMFCTHQRGEEINERLRFFIEECDHIQGIQFIVDDSGGFSGVAAEFLESIADDYSNIPALLYTVRSPGSYINMKSHKLNISRRLHDAVSFARLSSLCKLIVPVGLPSLSRSRASTLLSIKDEQPYYTSAVYASALHSLSLPFRIQHPGPTSDSVYACGELDMYEVIHMLADQSRQNMVCTLDVSMPAPSLTGDPSQWSLFENFIPLTPEVAKDIEDRHVIECMTVHGVLGSGNRRVPVSEVKNAVQGSYESTALPTRRPKFLHLSATRCPLPIPLPFPTLFGNAIGQNGEILETPLRDTCGPRGSLDVHSVPVAARLRSTTAILPFLERRLENLRKLGIRQGGIGVPVLESWGFGREEVEDLGEKLSHMVSTLNPYSDHSSDSD